MSDMRNQDDLNDSNTLERDRVTRGEIDDDTDLDQDETEESET